MIKYIAKRILFLIPVLLGVSLLVFTLLYITPGDPAKMMLGDQASEAQILKLREEMGLNDPFLVQYGRYIANIIFRGDLGTSYSSRLPVLQELLIAFPKTLLIASSATVFAIIFGVFFGVTTAIKQYSIYDNIMSVVAMLGVSMPSFWIGLLLILLFSVRLGWLPPSGLNSIQGLILPMVVVGSSSMAFFTRMTRSSMLEVINQDYIRTARSKGQIERKIILKHGFKNALIPIMTSIGLEFGYLLGGAIIAESIFSISGIGLLMINSIKNRDYPIVQGGVLFIAFVFSLVNLLVDLLYTYVDPRIKFK